MSASTDALDATALFEQARAYVAAGDYVSAFGRVLSSLKLDNARAEGWDLLARLQLQFSSPAEALESAAAAVQLAPYCADFHYSLGRALKATDRVTEAVESYRRAAQIDPTRPHFFCSLGIALRSLGRLDEAIQSYQTALSLQPRNTEARHNLANVLREAGRPREAVAYADSRLDLTQVLDGLVRRAAAHHAQAEFKQALVRWTDVLRLAPTSAPAYHGLAAALNALHRYNEALQYEERALTLQPDYREALDGARRLALFAGEVERVERYGKRLHALAPSSALRMVSELALPVIHESVDSIAQTRARFDTALDGLLAAPPRISQPNDTVGNLGFYLAYHGESNCGLQAKLGRLMLQSCPDLNWTAPHCQDYRRPAARLRIGFASELLRNHSIGKTSAGLIAQLDRTRFEVSVLNLPGSSRAGDPMQQWIRAHCDHWLSFDGPLPAVREAIAALKLDVLFYPDIGMTPFSCYLAYARLAPLQCVSFGHPDTTGIPNLDYFISNDLYETPQSAEHYSEQLVQLHDLPTLAYYRRPEVPTEVRARSHWGIGDTENLYVCVQTLFKLHPDFDRMLSGILARDARARIVLIEGQYRGWSEQLRRRFERSMGGDAQRITFLDRMDAEEYLSLLRAADVALDTVHFNGMNSSLEALAMGTPVVTLPTQLQRGRHTQAMYRQMELTDAVARDTADYVDIAVRIGTDTDFRCDLRRRIDERSAVLFENRRVVTAIETFFEQTLEARH